MDINKKIKDELTSFKGDQKNLMKLFNYYKKEFMQIKDKFGQLSEFIIDARFRANIASDAKKQEFLEMSRKLNSTSNKKTSLINGADTFDLNKKGLKNNFDIFESPFNNTNNKYNTHTYKYSKRNSVQMGDAPNKVINKFEINQRAELKKNINGLFI